MNRAEIETTLREILEKNVDAGTLPAVLDTNTNLREDLGLDSLEQIEMIFKVEEHFGITFSDEEARQLQTVGDIITNLMRPRGSPGIGTAH